MRDFAGVSGTQEVGMKAQWTIRASLVGAAVLAVCAGVRAQAPVAPAHKVAAVVDGEAIPEEDIDQVANLVIKDRFKLQQQPTDQQRREVRLDVINMAVDDVLMRHFLAKSNIKANPADIEKR